MGTALLLHKTFIFTLAVFTLAVKKGSPTKIPICNFGNNNILLISKEMSMQGFLRTTSNFSNFYLSGDNGHYLDFFSTEVGRFFLNSSLRNDVLNSLKVNSTAEKLYLPKLIIPYALTSLDSAAENNPKSKEFENLVKTALESDTIEGVLLSGTFTECSFGMHQRSKELSDIKQFRKLTKDSHKSLKQGILYKLHYKQCLQKLEQLRPLVEQSDFVVFDLRPPAVYTFDGFQSFIDENIKEVVANVKRINFSIEIIIKFTLCPVSIKDKTEIAELLVFHAFYAQKWAKLNNMRIILDFGYAHTIAIEKLVNKLKSTEQREASKINCQDLVSSLWKNKIKHSGVKLNLKETFEYTTAEVKTVLNHVNETFGWMIAPKTITVLNEVIELSLQGKVIPLIEEVDPVDLKYMGENLVNPYMDANDKLPGTVRGIIFDFKSRTKLFSYLEHGRAKRDTTSNTHYSRFAFFEDIVNVMNSTDIECGISMRYPQMTKLLTAAGKSKFLKKSFTDIQFMVWTIDFGTIKFEIEGSLHAVLEKLSDLRTSYKKRFPKLQILFEVGWRKTTSTPLTGDQCDLFLIFWETIFTWASIHQFELIVADALSYGNDFGWWKILDDRDLSYKPTFVERLSDPCITVNSNGDVNKRLDINQELVGITFNPTVRNNGSVSQDEFETMVTIITKKFKVIELIWKPSKIKFKNVQSGTEIYISPELQFSSKSEMLEILGELKILVNTAAKGTIKGIHIRKNFEGCQFFLAEMKKQIDRKKFPSLSIGVSIPSFRIDALSSNSRDLEKLLNTNPLSLVNYVIWDVETKVFAKSVLNEYALPLLFEEQRKVRVSIQRMYPNVKNFISRLAWPGGGFGKTKESTRDFLRFWNRVNDLSTAYNIPYFINQAYEEQVHGNATSKNGWWRVQNYSDLSDASVYEEIEADYLKPLNFSIPSESVDKSSHSPLPTENFAVWKWTTILTLLIIMLLLFALAIQATKNYRKQALLSRAEVTEFVAGAASTNSSEENVYERMKYKGNKYEIPKQEFRFNSNTKEILGMGHYGIVYKLLVFRFPNEVAVKVPHNDCSNQSFKSLLSEIKIMSYVGNHDHVVHFLGAYTKEITKGIVYIVTELCAMGSLHSHLKQLRSNAAESVEKLIRFCVEIGLGMKYISDKGVIHGDLSARNVLLDANGKCKISDFGLSRKLYQYEVYVKDKQEELPWRWLAIESLKRFEYSIKSDVWSFGVTIWEIFSFGDVPYPGQAWDWEFVDKLADGMRMKKPEIATNDIYAIMQNCWKYEPEQRPNFDDLVTIFQTRSNEYALRQYTDLCDAVIT